MKRQAALLWDQAALKEFDAAERVAKAVKIPSYTATMNSRDVTVASADALLQLVGGARNISADAVQTSTEALGNTLAESKERVALLAVLREVQAAARQKYHGSDPVKLRDFAVGARLGSLGFANLTGIADAVREKVEEDTLPGFDAARKARLAAAIDAFKNADAAQGGARGQAGALRRQRDAAVAEIRKARQVIQFAADAAWPYTDPDSKPAREAFLLPAARPYTG